jgi:diguanylate cyclase (GGDEF)-like protein
MKGMFAAMLPDRFRRRRSGDRLVQAGARPHKCYWAIACEIDDFRLYNDIYGRKAGDEVLALIGEALSGSCRGGEQVFRRSGAEYVMTLPTDSVEEARGCAERHRLAVEALQIPHQGSPLGIVTVSMGLATIVADGPEATAKALEMADAALGRAKERGRNRIAGVGLGLAA